MKKGAAWLIVLAVFAVVAFLFLAGPNGLIKLIQMKQREAELERRMVSLQAEIEITHQRVQRLASDPDYLRKVAKERLQMIDYRDSTFQDSTSNALDSASKVNADSSSLGID
ncbi:septum formation initiator family protein [candidate division WOR-3 bacterium]|nr:septum formation initiator family protein [candidate division WOR-3 bacterium]